MKKELNKLYYCKHCKKIMIRNYGDKKLVNSFCDDTQKDVKLKLIKLSDIPKLLNP